MDLFNRFNETIIYKKESELEKQIEALKKLHNEYPKNYNISKQLKLCELGLMGEKEIEFELKNANIGMYVLHDITMKYEELTAQIDYMVITRGFTYLIECKNLIGNITVNNRGEFIREYELGGKKIKEGFYSPIRQAERHLEVFEKVWNKFNNSLFDKLIKNPKIKEWYKPLAVMANSKNILNTRYVPKEIRNKIIKADSLVKYIEKDINSIDRSYLISKKTMENNAEIFSNVYSYKVDRNYEEEYRKLINNSNNQTVNIQVNNQDSLKLKLLKFREVTAKQKKIPPYYVFTNEELDKLLKSKPKTMSELRLLKIMPEVKTKIHGPKIIEILNNDI